MKAQIVKDLRLLAGILMFGIALLYTSCSSRNPQVPAADLHQIQKEIGEELQHQDDPTQELLYFVEKRLPSDAEENEHASTYVNGRVSPLFTLASAVLPNSDDPLAQIAQSRIGVLPSERYIMAAQHTAAMRISYGTFNTSFVLNANP